jgi:hypothetical protein
MNILDLPRHILEYEIISKLSIDDIKNLHETSKELHYITNNLMEKRAEERKKKFNKNDILYMKNKRSGIFISDIDKDNQLRKTVTMYKIDLWKIE